jgi:hypothetical protein
VPSILFFCKFIACVLLTTTYTKATALILKKLLKKMGVNVKNSDIPFKKSSIRRDVQVLLNIRPEEIDSIVREKVFEGEGSSPIKYFSQTVNCGSIRIAFSAQFVNQDSYPLYRDPG